jgi:hypothetical protein
MSSRGQIRKEEFIFQGVRLHCGWRKEISVQRMFHLILIISTQKNIYIDIKIFAWYNFDEQYLEKFWFDGKFQIM